MIDWHRLFGLALRDLFTDSPYTVELEKDLSLKQQFLDIVILRNTGGTWSEQLPDGLDNLAEHNLITYKSMREPLDDWALKELTGHYVNYRKQLTGATLLPETAFKLYAVATRYPRKLAEQVVLEKLQPGVYQIQRGTDCLRLIVLSSIPRAEHNALWHMFSGVNDLARWGSVHYQPHTEDMSSIINRLFDNYRLEGINMPYTIEDFRLDIARENLHRLSTSERLLGLPSEERLRGLPLEERLLGLSQEELARLKALLDGQGRST